MKISVMVCTHKPREDYFQRVLEALQIQTLSRDEWELIIVDNASPEPLSKVWDISWHPRGRYLREETLGISHARICGITHAVGEIIVFVDDDNVLAPDYLEATWAIAQKWPMLGAWNGSAIPEFEEPPPAHIEPFVHHLALRTVTQDRWGNPGTDAPFGAGMGFQRKVGLAYVEQARHNKARLGMGRRRGVSMLGGEDKDIATTSFDLGLGTGVFGALKLTHLIPKRRLTDEYMLSLIRGNEASYIVEDAVRGIVTSRESSRVDHIVSLYKYWRGTPWDRQVHRARVLGRHDARKYLEQHGIKR